MSPYVFVYFLYARKCQWIIFVTSIHNILAAATLPESMCASLLCPQNINYQHILEYILKCFLHYFISLVNVRKCDFALIDAHSYSST